MSDICKWKRVYCLTFRLTYRSITASFQFFRHQTMVALCFNQARLRWSHRCLGVSDNQHFKKEMKQKFSQRSWNQNLGYQSHWSWQSSPEGCLQLITVLQVCSIYRAKIWPPPLVTLHPHLSVTMKPFSLCRPGNLPVERNVLQAAFW